LKALYEGIAKKSFEEDLRLGKEMGVRGFPTIFLQTFPGRQQWCMEQSLSMSF
jgi:protein-disulfide isomerase